MTVNYQKRLDAINKTEGRTVWDCIDRPMRRLVFEFNRIGLVTKFSCFGFPYDGEEEPKTHHASWSYIHFFPTTQAIESGAFVKFIQIVNSFISTKCVSLVKPWPESPVLDFRVLNTVGNDLYSRHEPGHPYTIHQYEANVLIIHNFCLALQENIPNVVDVVSIFDGNAVYNDELPEWQVKAKPTAYLHVEDFYKEHGKLEPLKLDGGIQELLGDYLTIANVKFCQDMKGNIVDIAVIGDPPKDAEESK